MGHFVVAFEADQGAFAQLGHFPRWVSAETASVVLQNEFSAAEKRMCVRFAE